MTLTFTKDINVKIMTTGYKFEGGLQEEINFALTLSIRIFKHNYRFFD